MTVAPQAVPMLSIREADRLRAVARRVPALNAGAQNNCGVMLARRGLAHEAAACFERALDVDARMSLAAQNLQQLAARTPVVELVTITSTPSCTSSAASPGSRS